MRRRLIKDDIKEKGVLCCHSEISNDKAEAFHHYSKLGFLLEIHPM